MGVQDGLIRQAWDLVLDVLDQETKLAGVQLRYPVGFVYRVSGGPRKKVCHSREFVHHTGRNGDRTATLHVETVLGCTTYVPGKEAEGRRISALAPLQ